MSATPATTETPQADLIDLLAEFYQVPVTAIQPTVIHLNTTTDRTPLIDGLKKTVLSPDRILMIADAIDGREFDPHPLTCVFDPTKQRTKGELGCLLSHVGVAAKALDTSGIEVVVIFEDDCIPVLPRNQLLGELRGYFQEVRALESRFQIEGARNMILLGCSGTYSQIPIGRRVKATNKFNGTHAYVMNRAGMELLVKTYTFLLSKGKMAPIDGLWGLILRAEKRHAMCPVEDQYFFSWAKDMPSQTS